MQNTSINQNRLIRSSQLAALVFLIGFAVIGSAIGYSVWQLHTLEKDIQAHQNELDGLKQTVADLGNTVQELKYSPSTESIVPKAHAQPLPVVQGGRPLYDLSIWIDLSNYHIKQVRQVTYRSDHPELRDISVREPATGFTATFRTNECPGRVTLNVVFTDDTTQIIDGFEMCNALRADAPSLPCLSVAK